MKCKYPSPEFEVDDQTTWAFNIKWFQSRMDRVNKYWSLRNSNQYTRDHVRFLIELAKRARKYVRQLDPTFRA